MEIARLYRDAQRSFVELARTLDDADWTTPVPCCPGWTVRDVLSHAAGVTLDITAGNVEGAATEPWTAAQVARWRDTPVDELLAAWDEAIAGAADAIDAFGEARPPFDCHIHEHDVRQALGRPGNRGSELMRTAMARVGLRPVGRPVTVIFDDGVSAAIPGDGPALSLAGVSPFELTRSRFGRRSRDQVAAWAWSEPLADVELSAWFVFGPSAKPIDE